LRDTPEPKTIQPETIDPDQIELDSMDSFPASDPPSWILMHIGRPHTSAHKSRQVADPRKADVLQGLQCAKEQITPEPHSPDRVSRKLSR